MIATRNIGRNVALSAVLGALVFAALGLVTDARQVGSQLAAFAWANLGPILGWTLFNYALRWLKWDYYLRKLGMGHGVSRVDSLLLFTAGMLMAVTPGKVGEVFKSYLLKRVNGTAISASAPIVIAERLTDGLGMLILMALGLNLYPPARPLFWLLLLVGAAGIALLHYRPAALWLIARLEGVPGLRRIGPAARAFYASSFALLSWRLLLVSTVLSVISWGGECLAFFYVLTGFGLPGSAELLLIATFVFAASTLFGLVSFLPGGLGTSEAASVALLVALLPAISLPAASAATIMIRFCTLWFGVSLGVLAWLVFERRYRAPRDEAAELRMANET